MNKSKEVEFTLEQLTGLKQNLTELIKLYKTHSPHWNDKFSHFARFSAHITGRPLIFYVAIALILLWAITGPLFGYSDTWQLIINTTTTIITFLMVFLIQHTQNRDTDAIQVKLDELIRSIEGAHNALLNLEELEDEELDLFKKRYADLARKARAKIASGLTDTGTPDINN